MDEAHEGGQGNEEMKAYTARVRKGMALVKSGRTCSSAAATVGVSRQTLSVYCRLRKIKIRGAGRPKREKI